MKQKKKNYPDIFSLGNDIVEQYKKFGVNIKVERHGCVQKRAIFEIRPKGNSREAHIRAHAPDVQLKLKLPLFQVVKEGLSLYIIASPFEFQYPHLQALLKTPDYQTTLKEDKLPYIVGHDVLGNVLVEDLEEFPHLLVGGSTNSGKSVGLQALITSIACVKSPLDVGFVIIDTGSSDLLAFATLPHLFHPIVQDRATALKVLTALTVEMETRIKLENSPLLRLLCPSKLVVVIDEFPSLFRCIEKKEKQALVANISNLLQRGRHAGIHIVLAAQNPTFLNMQVDLSNITTRIAFTCAKKNFSETILGESGAENLSGHGDLLLKTLHHNSLQRAQGAYITPVELQRTVRRINARYSDKKYERFKLDFPDEDLMEPSSDLSSRLKCSVIRNYPSDVDRLLSDVILWALAHDNVSINALKNEHHLGWNTASSLFRHLEKLGIVAPPNSTLPREVIPKVLEDLPDELMEFLHRCSYTRDSVTSAFQKRSAESNSHRIPAEF